MKSSDFQIYHEFPINNLNKMSTKAGIFRVKCILSPGNILLYKYETQLIYLIPKEMYWVSLNKKILTEIWNKHQNILQIKLEACKYFILAKDSNCVGIHSIFQPVISKPGCTSEIPGSAIAKATSYNACSCRLKKMYSLLPTFPTPIPFLTATGNHAYVFIILPSACIMFL